MVPSRMLDRACGRRRSLPFRRFAGRPNLWLASRVESRASRAAILTLFVRVQAAIAVVFGCLSILASTFAGILIGSLALNAAVLLLILFVHKWAGEAEIGPANALSTVRALLAAPLALLVVDGHFGVALLVYLICLVSDVLDGAIARARDERTEFGAAIDPLADILTTAGLYGAFLTQGMLPPWVFLVLLVRYVSLFAGVAALSLSSIPLRIRATVIGKIVGVLQGAAGIMMLFVAEANMQFPENIEVTLFPFLGIIFGSVIISQLVIGVRSVRNGLKSAGS